MTKYSKELVDKIVSLIEEDTYTITDICRILNVDRKSFYRWKSEKADFAESIAAATENREERLKIVARQAIRRKLDGYKLVETKTVYALDKNSEDVSQLSVKEYVVKDKYCVPETSAIAFALSEGTGKGGKKRVVGGEEMRPISIVVKNEQTKKHLELLRKNLQSAGVYNKSTNAT